MDTADDPLERGTQAALAMLRAALPALGIVDARPEHLLPVLQALRAVRATGEPPRGLDEADMRAAAALCNVSRAEVYGVLSFYDDLHAPVGVRLELCAAEGCLARGAGELLALTASRADVRAVYCLGNCACGPSGRVGERILARLDTRALAALLAADASA